MKMVDNRLDSVKYLFADFSDLRFSWIEKETSRVVSKVEVGSLVIILHAKTSLLFNTGEPWGKKSSSGLFDVTMGSFDGAETHELVGASLLHIVRDTHDYNFGLYRDGGLGITKASPRQTN